MIYDGESLENPELAGGTDSMIITYYSENGSKMDYSYIIDAGVYYAEINTGLTIVTQYFEVFPKPITVTYEGGPYVYNSKEQVPDIYVDTDELVVRSGNTEKDVCEVTAQEVKLLQMAKTYSFTDARDGIVQTSINELLEVVIKLPGDAQNHEEYWVYIYDEETGEVSEISTTPNEDGEYFEISEDGKTITIYTNKSNTFVVDYFSPDRYEVILPETTGGTVTTDIENPKAGDVVTIYPEPEEGYEVGKVVVKDEEGNTDVGNDSDVDSVNNGVDTSDNTHVALYLLFAIMSLTAILFKRKLVIR